MLASTPASILNQTRFDLGIPNQFRPNESNSSVQHPDDGHADLAQFLGQCVDRVNDVARSGHLCGCSGRTEQFLHVDDHERGAAGIKFFEPVIAAAPGEDPIRDFLTNIYFVHGVSNFGCHIGPHSEGELTAPAIAIVV